MSTVDDCLMFCSELVWIKLTKHTMKHTLNRHEAAATVLFLSFCIFRFNFGNLGFWFPWSLVLLIVAAALFTYIALLLVWTPISDFNPSGTWKCNRKPIKKKKKKENSGCHFNSLELPRKPLYYSYNNVLIKVQQVFSNTLLGPTWLFVCSPVTNLCPPAVMQ